MALAARIYVTPRKDVLDPQGTAVGDALHALGFDDVTDVRVGRYVELTLSGDEPAEAERQLRAMCEKLIANPVVEDFRFEITRVEDGT